MPPKKTYRKKPVRRKNFRRRKPRFTRSMQLVPQNRVVKMRYGTTIALSPQAAGSYGYAFSLNNLYDPDSSGLGHYPTGWHYLQQTYSKYLVLGAKIKATFMPRSASSPSGNALVGLEIRSTPSWSLSRDRIVEQCQYKLLGGGYANRGKCILSRKVSTKKFFGVKDIRDNIVRFGGTLYDSKAYGEPSEQLYGIVYAAGQSDAESPSINVIVEIEYIVEVSKPLPMMNAQSVNNDASEVYSIATGAEWVPPNQTQSVTGANPSYG